MDIDERKDKFDKDFREYVSKVNTDLNIDKHGNSNIKLKYKNPIVLNSTFLYPMEYSENKYNFTVSELEVLFKLYCYIISNINNEIGVFPPSLSSFCRFIDISTERFKMLKQDPDEEIRKIICKVEDYCYDMNVSLSQSGLAKERATTYRMKSEQEKMEKEQPHIFVRAKNINIGEMQDKIHRIKELQDYNTKSKLIEKETGGIIDGEVE